MIKPMMTIFILASCASNFKRESINSNIDSLREESFSRIENDYLVKSQSENLIAECYKNPSFDIQKSARVIMDEQKNNFYYWSAIGSCYIHKNQNQKGLFFYKLSFGNAKNNLHKSIYYNNMGVYYTKISRFDLAITFFEKSLNEHPKNQTPHMNLAMIFSQFGLKKIAKKHISFISNKSDPHYIFLNMIVKNKSRNREISNFLPEYLSKEEKDIFLKNLRAEESK